MNNAAFIEAQASYVAAAIAADVPPPDIRCCFNCRAWKVRDWPHCQSSGPWGGKHAMPVEPGCVFMPATRSQMLTRHGYKRRPSTRHSGPRTPRLEA
jgi:hypothetical protein